jgi:hypothetical protein
MFPTIDDQVQSYLMLQCDIFNLDENGAQAQSIASKEQGVEYNSALQ